MVPENNILLRLWRGSTVKTQGLIDQRALERFAEGVFLITLTIPSLVLCVVEIPELSTEIMRHVFLLCLLLHAGMFSLQALRTASNVQPIVRYKSELNSIAIRSVLIMLSLVAIAAIIVGNVTGAIGDRTALEFKNINDSATETVSALLVPALSLASALLLSLAIKKNSLIYYCLGGALAGCVLGYTGTRWQLIISLSPIICNYVLHNGAFRVLLATVITFVATLPFAVYRNTETLDWLSARDSALLDIPAIEAAYAIEMVGEHADGFSSFLSGIVFYYLPRVLFDKGIDQTMRDYIGARGGFDMVEVGGNFLPSFIGSAYMYGGPFAVFALSALIAALLQISARLILKSETIVTSTIGSLLVIGLCLQVRNISPGYLTAAVLAVILFLITRLISTLLQYKELPPR